jgi:carotenoid 1,2-hydratase
MLDAPFYARATIETTIGGERLSGVHEVIDLRRYAHPAIRPMIAFRVPRRARWTGRGAPDPTLASR